MGSKEGNYIERYWRDATPEDAIREPPMVARFRQGKSDWFMSRLSGLDRQGDEVVWFSENDYGSDCQVYDAPDPGEGWRLIDVDKEQPEEGDQYLVHPSQWKDRGDCHGCFKDDKFYRRRIEQPKSEPKYVPFEWEDREQLRGRWVIDGAGDEQCIVRIEKYKHSFCVNGIPIEEFLWAWRFVDTGEPVGKRVD